MSVSEAQKVKRENARLQKLVAELTLDKDMLQSVIRKNSLGSCSAPTGEKRGRESPALRSADTQLR